MNNEKKLEDVWQKLNNLYEKSMVQGDLRLAYEIICQMAGTLLTIEKLNQGKQK